MRPRIRTLKPEVWQDERVGNLSHGARLLFVGLITMADDEGRLRELSTLILGQVFPYDDISSAKLSRWLAEIAASGMVKRYVMDGCCYIAFRHWTKHQRVDKANDSELPAPPEFDEQSTNGSKNNPRSIQDQSCPPRTRASGPVLSVPSTRDKTSSLESERALFDFWRVRCGHEQAKATTERIGKIRARRNEGYTDEQIREAIEGAARGAFVNAAGKRFDDIELICRNGSKLESFIERAGAAVVQMRPESLKKADRWRNAPEYQNRKDAG